MTYPTLSITKPPIILHLGAAMLALMFAALILSAPARAQTQAQQTKAIAIFAGAVSGASRKISRSCPA